MLEITQKEITETDRAAQFARNARDRTTNTKQSRFYCNTSPAIRGLIDDVITAGEAAATLTLLASRTLKLIKTTSFAPHPVDDASKFSNVSTNVKARNQILDTMLTEATTPDTQSSCERELSANKNMMLKSISSVSAIAKGISRRIPSYCEKDRGDLIFNDTYYLGQANDNLAISMLSLINAVIKHIPQEQSSHQELQKIRQKLHSYTPVNKREAGLVDTQYTDSEESLARKFDASFARYRIAMMEYASRQQDPAIESKLNDLDQAIKLYSAQAKHMAQGRDILSKGVQLRISNQSYKSYVRDNGSHKPISTHFIDVRTGSAQFCNKTSQDLFIQEKNERHAIYLTHNTTATQVLIHCFDLAAIGLTRNEPQEISLAAKTLRHHVENYTIAALGYHGMKLLETNLPTVEKLNFRTNRAQAGARIRPHKTPRLS
ncbi:MAG: hypothetical protein RBT70_02115 [Alphaproteobacteria bacterium]|jgi:hypothetical protein|nr:hypothetical protein [Alphaproteobacteria bacterium]